MEHSDGKLQSRRTLVAMNEKTQGINRKANCLDRMAKMHLVKAACSQGRGQNQTVGHPELPSP